MGLDGFLVILCRECHPPWKIRPYDRVINRHDPLVKFWCFVPHRPPTFLHHLTTAEPHHYCFTVAFLVRMGFQKSELCKMRREWVAKNICWWKKCQHGGLMGIACFKKGWCLPQIQTIWEEDIRLLWVFIGFCCIRQQIECLWQEVRISAEGSKHVWHFLQGKVSMWSMQTKLPNSFPLP